MPLWAAVLILFCVCFLLGSIPWGVVISRVFYHTDVRQYGSGNIGTTNSLRALGKVGGGAVFLLDFGKGLLSGFLSWEFCYGFLRFYELDNNTCRVILALSFLACIWGHIFSPWLHFKGGKGIAVAVGCLFFALGVWPTILELVIFAVLVALTKKVAPGSIAAAVACPFIALYVLWGNWLAWGIIVIAAVTVIWAHRENISRLLNGTEKEMSIAKSETATDKEN